MQRLAVADLVLADDQPGLDATLASAYLAKTRPHCLCVGGTGIPMYIAHVGERFIVKRMPTTGQLHAPDCASYDPPEELSGLGEVAGSAIQEDLSTGTTLLRLDFALSRHGIRRTPVAAGTVAAIVCS